MVKKKKLFEEQKDIFAKPNVIDIIPEITTKTPTGTITRTPKGITGTGSFAGVDFDITPETTKLDLRNIPSSDAEKIAFQERVLKLGVHEGLTEKGEIAEVQTISQSGKEKFFRKLYGIAEPDVLDMSLTERENALREYEKQLAEARIQAEVIPQIQPTPQEQQTIMEQQEINKGLQNIGLEGLIKSRVFTPFGVSGIGSTINLLSNPEKELKRVAVETALGLGGATTVTASTTLWKGINGASSLVGGLSIKSTWEGDRKQRIKEYMTATNSLNSQNAKIINAVNKGLISPQDAVMMWNKNWEGIYAMERKAKHLVDTDLEFFIDSKGRDEVVKIKSLIRMKPVLDAQLRQALLNPNPNIPDTEFNSIETEEPEGILSGIF